MPISVTCTGCNKRFKGPDRLAGKTVGCPNCGARLSIPAPEEEEQPPVSDLEAEPPAVPESEAEEAGAPPPVSPRRPATGGLTPRRSPQAKPAAAALPPLTTNDPPFWLRHLHWALVLALIPLALSLLYPASEEEPGERLKETLAQAPPEVQGRILQVLVDLDQGKGSEEDLFSVLPEQKFAGALLPRNSLMHWAFGLGAAVLFMSFLLVLSAQKTAAPQHLLGIGLFTATAGILFLLLVQVVAEWTQGRVIVGRSIVVLFFYILQFIGFSYRAALDPNNGFLLSFLGFTFGVGFCEEVCKALPLLWHYRHPNEQSWRGAFLWGLASGAGFGIAEGIMYSASFYNGVHGPGIYVVRFLSCVALHAVWTGSVAITLHQKQGLIQGEMSWYEYIPPLFLIVGVPMVLHGLYDTLLKKEMNALALGVAVLSFAFLAFQISRLGGADMEAAREALLREYRRRRAGLS
jgi:RsiW-degrading membrane proteinase PrsW (M82 family)/predicted  nucleic acid-binding Zn-ribbon protein